MSKEKMNTGEVAEYLNIHEKQVYALIKAGSIPCTRVTGKWLFLKSLIDDWLIENSPGNIPQELSRWKEYFFLQGKIDQGAGGLSEGEKQKLTNLRAFLKGSPLLVRDEPISDIDDASRKDLYAALTRGVSGKIVIIATHDERLIELADDVYRL